MIIPLCRYWICICSYRIFNRINLMLFVWLWRLCSRLILYAQFFIHQQKTFTHTYTYVYTHVSVVIVQTIGTLILACNRFSEVHKKSFYLLTFFDCFETNLYNFPFFVTLIKIYDIWLYVSLIFHNIHMRARPWHIAWNGRRILTKWVFKRLCITIFYSDSSVIL